MSLLQGRDLCFSPREGLRYEGLQLALDGGEALQVSGPSGCGKSTLLRIVARLRASSGGQLLLRGEPAERVEAARWRRRVAYLPQRPVMLPGTVRDNLAAGFATRNSRRRFDEQAARRSLQRLRFGERVEELLVQDAGSLSGGEAARVALCRALLLRPDVVLADELTAALDEESASAVVELLDDDLLERGGALVLVAHATAPWERLRARRNQLDLSGRSEGDG